jgi:hypothetical protein
MLREKVSARQFGAAQAAPRVEVEGGFEGFGNGWFNDAVCN